MSRQRFFLYIFFGSFTWYFFPGYIFQALSFFNWVCWIAPNNVVINQLFGYYTGLGMSVLTFDWAQVAYIGSPLAVPWWVSGNVILGFLFLWALAPILYYTNTWYAAFLPMLTRTPYDNTGAEYNISSILTPEVTLDAAKYEKYSPIFLSMTFVISYGLTFAAITATIVHSILYYGKQIWAQSRRSMEEEPDVHCRLMLRYPQVPQRWYAAVFGT